MNKLVEKDDSQPYVENLARPMRTTNNHVDIKLPIGKSGSFDAEFDLLESALSELQDNECESNSRLSNDRELSFDDIAKTTQSFNDINTSDNTPALKVLNDENNVAFCNLCQYDNRPYCKHNSSFPSTHHSKSVVYHQANSVVIKNSSDEIPHLDNSCSETKFEIQNSSIEAINKPEPIFESDTTFNTCDKKECDRPPTFSLKSLEIIEKDPKFSVNLCLGGEKLSHATEYSDEGCDFDTVPSKYSISLVNKLESKFESYTKSDETLVNSVINCECLPEIVETMGDTADTKGDISGHTDGSNDDSTIVAESETNIKVLDADTSQSNQCVIGEHENQDITGCNEEEYFPNMVTNSTTPCKQDCEIRTRVDSQILNEDENEPIKKGVYFSTPNVTRKFHGGLNDQSSDENAPDFGLMSPLDVTCLKGKQNLKRKYIGLQAIEEINEDTDSIAEKKSKVVEKSDSVVPVESFTSALPCFEAPARSLLKKWQLSCLSRNVSATTSFVILDEVGETEIDDCPKVNQEYESSKADDFEIACQSLTEELMKSSSNIETLEKYHSQVQLENQMDDEKFDEILKELTMNADLDDKTCLSVKSMDESTINESDKTYQAVEAVEEAVDALLSGTNSKASLDGAGPPSENNITIMVENKKECPVNLKIDPGFANIKIETKTSDNVAEPHSSSNDSPISESLLKKEKPSSSEEEVLDIDEEDVLLDENPNAKDKKPYEFFEFVSTDPKENEDNYHPEWQKLGRLTSDEERYKAVRDRWRSLVPPDPNKNLTYRQWRARNNKPPFKLSPLNNNHQLMDDNRKNQLCTAVFDNKITKIVQELEDFRMNIYRERNREFEKLGRVQDDEQMRATMSGINFREMALLHSNHLKQCRAVKDQYDRELKRIQEITEGKIRILREASQEVLLFQKFYKGVGARDDNEMYMTDIQVQELMETEEMLEQYKIFYK